MSATVDERIVEMKFDDKEFEEGVKSTLKYLDKLREELKLDDAAESANKAFKKIGQVTDTIDFDSVNKAIDTVNKRFSTLGIVGMTAIQNITNSIIDLGKHTIGGIIGTVFSKGWSRATNIDQASFTLKGLGLDVEQAMKDADFAVTDTAFGLDEAAKAASQLAASGIQLGDDMQQALLAISGTAAMTNSDFTSMADIFTTVAGNGRLMTMQLNQMSGRGLNAAASLAQYFREGLATEEEMQLALQLYENTLGEMDLTTEAGIRAATTAGQISFETFYHAMAALYGEHAKAANDTYEGAYANMVAALGRISQPWLQTWREGLTGVFNAVTPIIKAFKTISDIWITPHAQAAIRNICKFVIAFLDNIEVKSRWIRNLRTIAYKPLKLIANTIKQIAQRAAEVFDIPGVKKVGSFLSTVGKGLRSIHLTVKDVLFGDVHFKWSDEIVDAFGGVFSIINMAITGVKMFFRVTAPLWRIVGHGLLKILEGAGALGRALQSLNERFSKFYKIWSKGKELKNNTVGKMFTNVGESVTGFFKKLNDGESRFSRFKMTMSKIKEVGIVKTFSELGSEIGIGGTVASFFLGILEKIVNIGSKIKDVIVELRKGISIKDIFKSSDFGSQLLENMNKMRKSFKNIDFISTPMSKLKEKYSHLIGDMGLGGTIFTTLSIALQKVGAAFVKFGKFLKKVFVQVKDVDIFKTIANGIGKLKESIKNFKFEGSGLARFLEFIKTLGSNAFSAILSGFSKFSAGVKSVASFFSGGLGAIFNDIKRDKQFVQSFKDIGKGAEETGVKLLNLPKTMSDTTESLSEGGNKIKEFFTTTFSGWTAKDWIRAIKTGMLSAINVSLIGMINQIKSVFKNISGIMSSIKAIAESFKLIGKDIGQSMKIFASGIGGRDTKTKAEHLAAAIKDIAKAVLMIVAAVLILAIIPQDRLKVGLEATVVIASMVTGILIAMSVASKKAGDAKQVRALTTGVMKVCAAMLLMGIAISAIGKRNVASIIVGTVAIMAMLKFITNMFTSFGKMLNSFRTNSGNVSGAQQKQFLTNMYVIVDIIKQLSKAILIIGISLNIASKHEATSIAAAGAMLIIMLVTIFSMFRQIIKLSQDTKASQMVQAIAAFKTFAELLRTIGKSFLSMSSAIFIISATTKIFGSGTVWASFGMLELFIATVAGLATLLGSLDLKFSENFDKFGKAMIKISASLLIISLAIAIMGKLKTDTLFKGLTAISVIFVMIDVLANMSKEGKNLNQVATIILAASVLITSIGIVFKLIDGVDVNTALTATLAMVAVFSMLSILLKVVSKSTLYSSDINAVSVLLLATAVAVASVGTSFALMKGLDTVSAVAGIFAMIIMFGALVALIAVTKNVKPSEMTALSFALVAMGASVLMMAEGLAALDGLEHAVKSMIIFTIIVVEMTTALMLLSAVGTTSLEGTGLLVAGAALIMLSVAILAVAHAMAEIDKLEHGWKSFAIAAAAMATLTAVLIVLAGAGMVIGLGLVTMGIGVKELALGLLFFAAAAATFSSVVVIWQGQMDVLAAEIIVFLTELAGGLGTVGTVLATSITMILKAILDDIILLADDIADGIGEIILSIMTTLDAYAPDIVDKFLHMLAGVIFALAKAIRSDTGLVTAMEDLKLAVMAKVGRWLASVLRGFKRPLAQKLADAIDEETDAIDEAGEKMAEKEQKYADEAEQAAKDLKKSATSTGSILSDITGDLGIENFLSSDQLGAGLSNVFAGLDVSKISGVDLSSMIIDQFPGQDIFGQMGIEDGSAYMQSLLDQGLGGGEIMAMIKDEYAETAEAENAAGQAGSNIGKKFKKNLMSDLEDTEKGSKAVMKRVKKRFGEDSDEYKRLIAAGGEDWVKGIQLNIRQGNESLEGGMDEIISTLQTMTEEEREQAEHETEEIYSVYEEKGKAALQGLAAGLENKEYTSMVTAAGYQAGVTASEATTSALGEGSYENPNPSITFKTIGAYCAYGLAEGLRDSGAISAVKSAAASLAKAADTETRKEAEVESPSKKFKRTGVYMGVGLALGLEKSVGEIKKRAKNIVKTISKEFSLANVTNKDTKKILGVSLRTLEKSVESNVTKILKHIKKLNTKKRVKEAVKALGEAIQSINRIRSAALGLGRGRRGVAQVRLWESSDDYADLRTQLKDYKKEKADEFKKAQKYAKKNKYLSKDDVNSVASMKKRRKELNKQAKEDEKNNKKTNKERDRAIKKLDNYIKNIKQAKKNIKETHKEIQNGYKTYWKKYWKELKEKANENFRQIFVTEATKTFQLFNGQIASQVNITSASVKNSLNVISDATSAASVSVKFLSDSFELVTDAINATYDTALNLFQEFRTSWYNPTEFLEDMKDNLNGYEDWLSGLDKLASKTGTEDLVEYIKEIGFSSETLSQLNMFNNMTNDQLSKAINYLAQQRNYEIQKYLQSMREEVDAYNEWKADINTLVARGISKDTKERLEAMGVQGAQYAKMLANMTDENFRAAQDIFAEEAQIATDIWFENMMTEKSKWKEWQENLAKLSSTGLNEELIKQIKDMDFDEGADYVSRILTLSPERIAQMNELYSEQNKIANKNLVDSMKESYLDYDQYTKDILRLNASRYSKELKEYILSLGYEGYDTMKQFLDMMNDPSLVQEANGVYAQQLAVNAAEYLGSMSKEGEVYAQWVKNLEALEEGGLSRKMLKELMETGVDSADKVAALVEIMNQGNIKKVNQLFNQQQKLNSNALLMSTRENLSDWQEYYAGLRKLMDGTFTHNIKLDESIIDKIQSMGIDGLDYIREISNMEVDEIKELNKLAKSEQELTKQNLLISTVQEREKMKQWAKNIKKMAEQGFNAELIQQMFEAGYSETADQVALYADMEEDEIAQINKIWEEAASAAANASKAAYVTAANNTMVPYASEIESSYKLIKEAAKIAGQGLPDGLVETNSTIDKVAEQNADIIFASYNESIGEYKNELMQTYQALGADSANEQTKGFTTSIVSSTTDVTAASTDLGTAVSKAYIAALKDYYEKIQKAIQKYFKPKAGDGGTRAYIKQRFTTLGNQCCTAFANALKSDDNIAKVQKAAKKMAKAAVSAIKFQLDIHSPSRVLYSLGSLSVLGFANAVEDNAYLAGLATESLVDAALGTASTAIDELNQLGKQADLGLSIEPIFDPDAAATGVDAIQQLLDAKKMAINELSFNNVSDINMVQSLNNNLANLTNAIAGIDSYKETLNNIQALMELYLPEASRDIYLDGDKVSNYVEQRIQNNIVRRRARW